MQLRNNNIWITGGNAGIGKAVALELARRGANVGITGRDQVTLGKVKEEIERLAPTCKVALAVADVTKLDEVQTASKVIENALGSIDIAIANAGEYKETFPEHFNSAEYKRLTEVNYFGMFHVIESVLPKMIANQKGILVATCSVAGYRGLPISTAYGATKAAMINFLEGLRFDLEKKNIRVVIVNPGFVTTVMTKENDFYMPFLINAEQAAKYYCDGLEKEKLKIVFPPMMWLLMEAVRLLPSFIFRFGTRMLNAGIKAKRKEETKQL